MSVQNLPANTVAGIEPDDASVRIESRGAESDRTADERHISPDESPDCGPPIAELVEKKPITDDGKRALQFGASRYRHKRRIVAELLARELETVARRVASCGNNEFRCQRPPICRICFRRKRFDAKKRHSEWIKSWDSHVLVALTMPNSWEHPGVARSKVANTFNDIRNRVKFTNTVDRAFGGIHTVRDNDCGGYRAHLDLLCEGHKTATIKSELTGVWSDVGGGYVEATPITSQSNGTYADAVEATTCYVVEKTELPVSAQIDYYQLRTDGANYWIKHKNNSI